MNLNIMAILLGALSTADDCTNIHFTLISTFKPNHSPEKIKHSFTAFIVKKYNNCMNSLSSEAKTVALVANRTQPFNLRAV